MNIANVSPQLQSGIRTQRVGRICRSRHGCTSAFVTAGLLAGAMTSSYGEGFRNPPPGAFNLGRAGGRIAHVDDSSAVAQNPANLVELTGPEFQFTPGAVYIKVDYEAADGDTATTKNPWKLLPNFFAGVPLYDNNLAVGFGITTPYGLANEWDEDSPAFQDPTGWRYQTPHHASLMNINFRPAIAVKAGEYLTLGGGIDVMWSKLSLKQYYPWFLATGNFADADGTLKADSTGIGAGANFGATVHITERQRLAFTVQTPIRINYDGDVELSNVPDSLGGGTIQRDFETSIKYPLILSAGYGIELTDTIRLETDIEWLQFSNFKTLPLEVSGPSLGLPTGVPQNWKDTFTIGIGGDWEFARNWVFRAGYRFYESPVPESTFSPTIPDANQNVFTFGLAYTHGRHSLEGAYGLDFYDERTIDNNQNPILNGKYSMNVHLFSLAYRFDF
jgi:long-chain fatty acid transport protein